MFLRRRFWRRLIGKTLQAGRLGGRLASDWYGVLLTTMASGSRLFGVRFAHNCAWRAPYRGPFLGGGKWRKKGRGKEWARGRNRARREERAGEADLPASGRAGEEPEATPRPRGHVLPRRREKSLPPSREDQPPAGPRQVLWSSARLPSRLLWSAAALVLRLLWSAEPPPVMVLFVAVCLSTR